MDSRFKAFNDFVSTREAGLRATFDAMDVTGSGCLGATELEAALQAVRLRCPTTRRVYHCHQEAGPHYPPPPPPGRGNNRRHMQLNTRCDFAAERAATSLPSGGLSVSRAMDGDVCRAIRTGLVGDAGCVPHRQYRARRDVAAGRSARSAVSCCRWSCRWAFASYCAASAA